MQKLVLFFASFIAASAHAENLPIPSELTRGVYVTTSKEDRACYEASYDGASSLMEGGTGISLNANIFIPLDMESRNEAGKPGCFEHWN